MSSRPNGFPGSALAEPAAACAHLLFRALVETDGDRALLHTGDAPQLVTPIGRLDLVKAALTVSAVELLLSRLLPDDALERLDVSGVVQYECPPQPDLPGEHFSVVAARLHDDVRLEVRRLRFAADEESMPQLFPKSESTIPQDDQLSLPPANELWPHN